MADQDQVEVGDENGVLAVIAVCRERAWAGDVQPPVGAVAALGGAVGSVPLEKRKTVR